MAMRSRNKDILLEMITGKQGKRFGAFVNVLRFLWQMINKSFPPREQHLADALYYWDKMETCVVTTVLYDKEFKFDLFRMPFSGFMNITERDRIHDCYGFKDVNTAAPVVLDIGAHIGTFSRYVLHCKPESTIYAFEPDRENLSFLRLNCGEYDNMQIIDRGVLDKKGEIEFFISKKLGWRSTLFVDDAYKISHDAAEFSESYKVQLTDIDSFVEENQLAEVTFVKMTTVGVEDKVLEGMKNTIERFRPYFAVYIFNNNLDHVRSFFSNFSYKEVASSIPDSSVRIFQPK